MQASTIGLGPEPLVSTSVVALMIFGGLEYFRRMEKTFADIV
jgi:hypothetical protein